MPLRMRSVRSRGKADPDTLEEITDLTSYSKIADAPADPLRAGSPASFDGSHKSDADSKGDAGSERMRDILAHNHRRHARSRSADSASIERMTGGMRRATSIDDEGDGSNPSLPVRAMNALASNISSFTANISNMTSLAGQYAGGLVSGARSSMGGGQVHHYHSVATDSRDQLLAPHGSRASLAGGDDDGDDGDEEVSCAPISFSMVGLTSGSTPTPTIVESTDLFAEPEEGEEARLCSGQHADGDYCAVETLPGHRFKVRLLDWASLPEWLKDNDFIHGGYRPELRSFKRCMESLLYIHNETGNVYTHLIGFTTFFALAVYTCAHLLRDSQWEDHVMFWVFFMGAMICLLLSSLFHLVFCHSPRYLRIFSRLDYTGIAFLIAGSYFPCIYYGFYCVRKWKIVYLTAISVIGSVCIVVACFPGFDKPKYRVHRLLLFVAMGACGVVPVTHFLAVYGFNLARDAASFDFLMIMAALYLTGGAMYGARIPERFAPGKFDLLFHSHQLFHILVVTAALFHYYGMVRAFNFRAEHGCTRENAMYP
eukprot:Opistho-1_new@19686